MLKNAFFQLAEAFNYIIVTVIFTTNEPPPPTSEFLCSVLPGLGCQVFLQPTPVHSIWESNQGPARLNMTGLPTSHHATQGISFQILFTCKKRSRTEGWPAGERTTSMATPSCRHSCCSCWKRTSEVYCWIRSFTMFTHSCTRETQEHTRTHGNTHMLTHTSCAKRNTKSEASLVQMHWGCNNSARIDTKSFHSMNVSVTLNRYSL